MSVAEFTVQDFAQRLARAVKQAEEAGLSGVLIIYGLAAYGGDPRPAARDQLKG